MFGSSFATSSDSCQQLTPLQLRSFGQDSAGGPVVVSLLPATLERSSILLATACTTVTHTHRRVRFLWVLRGCDYVAARVGGCGHLGKRASAHCGSSSHLWKRLAALTCQLPHRQYGGSCQALYHF